MLGKLIVFEGIDGTGKTTLIDRAVSFLIEKYGGENVVQTKDPGATKLGTCIRKIMYEDVPTTEMAPGVPDLLFLSSHIQNWETVVKPSLEAGKWVVSDRWWYSQIAYMQHRTVPDRIAQAYTFSHGDAADRLIFLHGDPWEMQRRAMARKTETHQSSKAWNDPAKLALIQASYLDIFGNADEFWPVCVDGKTVDQVWEAVVPAFYFNPYSIADVDSIRNYQRKAVCEGRANGN